MGTQTRLCSVEAPLVDVFFGGRGSAMLTWLSLKPAQIAETLGNAFRLGLRRVADDGVAGTFPAYSEASLVVNFNGQSVFADSELPRLKTEVARGLLVKSEMK